MAGTKTSWHKINGYGESNPKKRAEFTEFLKKHDKSELVFVDESGIDLHREYCRAPKGEQVVEAVPGRKFERCSIVAGKVLAGHALFYINFKLQIA